MKKSHYQYLLIGAGPAANSAATTIRSLDPAGPLLLVGQEINRPYHRPHLTRDYLLGHKRHQDLFLHDPSWYQSHRIDLRTHRRAAHLDTSRHSVTLDDGEEVSFDSLLLATGAAPRPLTIPGSTLPNVFYLRTLEQADRLRHAIDHAHKQNLPPKPTDRVPWVSPRPPKVAIIGSGLLGLELSSTLTHLGLQVHLFSRDEYPLSKYLSDLPARSLSRYLESQSVSLHLNSPLQSLTGDGRAQRLTLSTGDSFPCDLVIVAIGISPHKELLRNTPLRAERAILTDDHCRTNLPSIYAAGDCAALFDPLFSKHRILDHWNSALSTGSIAGANMAGSTSTSYNEVSSFSTTIFNLTITSFGEPRLATRRLTRTHPDSSIPSFTEFSSDPTGRLVQITTTDSTPTTHTFLSTLLSTRQSLQGQEEHLKDPTIPLNQIFPLYDLPHQ
ncbi:MAG TPA: FAD/NAD(P)-binding oxidoreductase [Tepidisphaeraceae bacterium]|nr:FAD/NAD(P)-binding oxidoreductase [Tepidisphaeraceae bacterium]